MTNQLPPYPSVPSAHRPPVGEVPPSQTLAIVSLLCTFLCCIPAGVVMAIVVLQRCRDGRDHGRVLARTALVSSGLMVVANIVGTTFFLSLDMDGLDHQKVGKAARNADIRVVTFLGDMRRGSCVRTEPDLMRLVPCDRPHELEVHRVFELEHAPLPGEDDVEQWARRCASSFEQWVGVPPQASPLESRHYFPTPDLWEQPEERYVVCVAESPERIEESVRGSGR